MLVQTGSNLEKTKCGKEYLANTNNVMNDFTADYNKVCIPPV